ncbi:MAG: four helix bundle protein [Terriglobia bacterium]
MKSFKELEVWQRVVNLATETYKLTDALPRAERFGLTIQARRAAASVAANIAEGWGRGSTREYIQFLLIARGSLMELETHLIIARQLNYVRPEALEQVQSQIEIVGKMLNRLVIALRGRSGLKPPAPKP